jgi:hypothetical protein
MPFSSTDDALLKLAEFSTVYPNPYRNQLVGIGKTTYQLLRKPSGAVPNLAIFEVHLEVALHGSNKMNKLFGDILKQTQNKSLPPTSDSWWDGVTSAIARYLVWKDWSDISS